MLIKLTASYAGPIESVVYMNSDKIVKMEKGGDGGTRIFHEPSVDGCLDHLDVEESPAHIAKVLDDRTTNVEVIMNNPTNFLKVREV